MGFVVGCELLLDMEIEKLSLVLQTRKRIGVKEGRAGKGFGRFGMTRKRGYHKAQSV